jgi:hypothetical protein
MQFYSPNEVVRLVRDSMWRFDVGILDDCMIKNLIL